MERLENYSLAGMKGVKNQSSFSYENVCLGHVADCVLLLLLHFFIITLYIQTLAMVS